MSHDLAHPHQNGASPSWRWLAGILLSLCGVLLLMLYSQALATAGKAEGLAATAKSVADAAANRAEVLNGRWQDVLERLDRIERKLDGGRR